MRFQAADSARVLWPLIFLRCMQGFKSGIKISSGIFMLSWQDAIWAGYAGAGLGVP